MKTTYKHPTCFLFWETQYIQNLHYDQIHTSYTKLSYHVMNAQIHFTYLSFNGIQTYSIMIYSLNICMTKICFTKSLYPKIKCLENLKAQSFPASCIFLNLNPTILKGEHRVYIPKTWVYSLLVITMTLTVHIRIDNTQIEKQSCLLYQWTFVLLTGGNNEIC